MKILIVDDSTTIRAMIRRALAGLQQTDVAEAQNGLEALAEIGRRRFDLAILDVNMPVMDGLDALEAIRASAPHAALPVVVLTGEKSENVVRRLVEMGIADYVSKPLSQDRLSERLSHIITRLTRAPAASHTVRAAEHGQRVLVVEHDPDRRHFLGNVLAQHFTVVETDSGAGALQMMMGQNAPAFDVVFVGEQIGLPPPALFIPKMRTVPQLAQATVVVCRHNSGSQGSLSPDTVDAVIDWTYVPEVFLAAFERAVTGVDTPLAGMPSFLASLERDAVCATEQLFGLMLSAEVALVPAGGTPVCPWPGRGVHARLDLVAPGAASVAVLFRADAQSATAITAQLIGVAPEDVHDSDVTATTGEFANIIAGRLRNRLIEAGVQTRMQLPTTWTGATTDGFPASDAITLTFNLTRPPASFGLLLLAARTETVQVPSAA